MSQCWKSASKQKVIFRQCKLLLEVRPQALVGYVHKARMLPRRKCPSDTLKASTNRLKAVLRLAKLLSQTQFHRFNDSKIDRLPWTSRLKEKANWDIWVFFDLKSKCFLRHQCQYIYTTVEDHFRTENDVTQKPGRLS